jgi:SAM-dependent methyltransferase
MSKSGLFRRLSWLWRVQGPKAVVFAVRSRFARPRAKAFEAISARLRGVRGLEIGGPSGIFSSTGIFPVYPVIGSLDNCNFGSKTVWEGKIEEGKTFRYDERHEPGMQFIREATDLRDISSECYDIVLSSHTLEHTANPLRALAEWKRVLRPGGTLVLIVPHKDGTFDHRRPGTTLKHLEDDLAKSMSEDDQTHVPEVIALHDVEADDGVASRDELIERSRKNKENRCLHHHVFTTELIAQVATAAGFKILALEPMLPFHIISVLEKPAESGLVNNSQFLSAEAVFRGRSPFRSDRQSGNEQSAD